MLRSGWAKASSSEKQYTLKGVEELFLEIVWLPANESSLLCCRFSLNYALQVSSSDQLDTFSNKHLCVVHCRAEHSSKGGEKSCLLPSHNYLHSRHGSYAHDKMILQKITTTICNLDKISFSVLIAGEASRAQTHWRRYRELDTGHGGANKGRKPSGKKYNKMFRQSVHLLILLDKS